MCGKNLIHFQNEILEKLCLGSNIEKTNLNKLKNNLWIKLAYYISPSNIVIRQLCLIDLINGNDNHRHKIVHLMNLLTGDLWLEGYSYWKQLKPFILKWSNKYFQSFSAVIKDIDNNFQRTAYKGSDDLLYPAPFGELKKECLEDCLQNKDPEKKIKKFPIRKEKLDGITYLYYIEGCPVGFNPRIPDKNMLVRVTYGDPMKFDWYQEQYLRIGKVFSWERLKSVFRKETYQETLRSLCK